MFTGFASENTPAIQVWDFFRTFASTAAIRSVSLPDDCAPIQVFRTGATTSSAVRVYLPTAPIEGKQITIVNQYYGLNAQKVEIYSSDTSGNGSSSNALFTLGSADSLIIVYSKQNISIGTGPGIAQTGWFALNKGSPNAVTYYSAIVGGDNNAAPSSYSFIGGGSNNTASSQYSAVVGGSGNTATGVYSAVVSGQSNVASGQWAFVSGAFNTSSGTASAIIGGSDAIASSTQSVVVGGGFNRANAGDSVVLGARRGITRSISPMIVIASGGPLGVTNGASQTGVLVLARQTTDATATRLASDGNAAGTTNQVILPNNSAYYFRGSITSGVTGGGASAMWSFEGGIKRGADAASTTIIQSVINPVAADAGASTWIVAISADTTNGGLAVTVTGQASTTIRWVCKIETTEMTF